MNNKCPVYFEDKCFIKTFSNPEFISRIKKLQLQIVSQKWNDNCQGNIGECSFHFVSEDAPETKIEEVTKEIPVKTVEKLPSIPETTRVSIHKQNNPYLVKSDVLIYPTNISLTIDDSLLHRMSRGVIQEECDKFKKPIKMGTVYITSNGSENTSVKPGRIYHAVVAGASRLVNEEDIRTATRKALILANQEKHQKVVMLPADCGTHDINDTARVQLSAIKTFLKSNKNCEIKNIYIVMEDEESYKTFQEYYDRIFV